MSIAAIKAHVHGRATRVALLIADTGWTGVSVYLPEASGRPTLFRKFPMPNLL